MEIYNQKGRLKSDELKITKSISSLIFCTDKSINELNSENITIWIERVNGSNVYIAQSVKLVDYLMLTNYGSDAIQSDKTFKSIALAELSSQGAVQLSEGESLKIKLDSLTSANTYAIYSVEDPITTLDFHVFDRKTLASEELQKTLEVKSADLCVIDMHGSIKELLFKFSNGTAVKYLPFELTCISRDNDPVFAIQQDNTVLQGHSQRVVLPLLEVDFIEFVKDTGAVIEVTTRKSANLLTIE
jgi:hypothetical protein